MMRILDVRPAGFRIIMEYDLEDLEKLLAALSCAEFNPDTPEKKAAAEYVTTTLYPELQKFLEKLNDGT